MNVKQAVARVVPSKVRRGRVQALRMRNTLRELVPATAYDLQRYWRYSSSNGPYSSRENLRSKITATYHNIEKGLSLPRPRPGFGVQQVETLLRFVKVYVDQYGYDGWVTTPLSVLHSYRDFNLAAGAVTANDGELENLLSEAGRHVGAHAWATAVKTVDRSRVHGAVTGVGLDFFNTRSSVRQYSPEPVKLADIEFAVAAAQSAPAVCNRQYNRIYVYRDKQDIARILDVQQGARGFAEELGGLAVVTSDLRNFWAAGERNQAWVDGGLFAMNFMLGLHSRGLGTVALNWSKPPEVDRRLREVVDLPQEAVIIMLVGFGVLRESYVVATSSRLPLEDIFELR